MDEIPSSSPSPNFGAEESLVQEIKALRKITTLLLFAMACLSVAMTIFFYHQARNMNRQMAEGERVINDYNSNVAPRIQWFLANLQAFAKTNPDVNPILAKYYLLPNQGQPPPAGRPVSPAPVTQPAKK